MAQDPISAHHWGVDEGCWSLAPLAWIDPYNLCLPLSAESRARDLAGDKNSTQEEGMDLL